MLSFINQRGMTFQQNAWEDLGTLPDNPGRGFYRIYTYYPGVSPFEPPVRYEGENLALVLMDIGAWREEELSAEVLREMSSILKAFEDLGFQLIVRICYDTEGKGMVREPSLFSLVKRHFTQVIDLLKEFADVIYVYQGLLIGNWGEMHESKFLSPKCLREMITLFEQNSEGKISLAIRKPLQLRSAFSEKELAEGIAGKGIGFFNDGIMGSQTHLGTFAPETAGRRSWQEPWGPAEEIGFMKPYVDKVPYGGEALYPPEAMTPEQVIGQLSDLRVSYLNSIHEERALEAWKKTPYAGNTLYAYVERHLGYALWVQKAELKFGKKWECTVTVQNKGFGALYDETEVVLWGREENGDFFSLGKMEGELRGMASGETRRLKGTFDRPDVFEREKKCQAELFVSMHRVRDHRMLYFEQKAQEGRLQLGTIRKGR